MFDKIIFWSIHNKLIVCILTFFLVVLGVWSLTKLPIDAVPDITNNQVQVITQSPSLAAQEVEKLITFPVEVSMSSIPNVEEVRSISRFGLSVVTVVFHDEIDVYWARQQVLERLKSAAEEIPIGVGIPSLAPVTSGLGEIYQYIIKPKKGYEGKYSPMELRSLQDWIVRRQLLGTKGVADVSSFGGYLKEYEVAVDPEKLRSMNISLSEVFSALERNNQNTGGGYIDKRPNAWFIRTEGMLSSLDDIRQIVVKQTFNGSPVLIDHLAKVQFGHAIRYGAMTLNDEGEVVGAIVMMLKGSNSNEVISNVKSKIRQIQNTLPEGVVIEAFLDRTKLVNNAISTVSKNLIEGALIVIFVLVLMLGNIRAGLVVASVIPLAMLFAVSLMYFCGVSGNLMSLGAIDFGLIVDGAVIIVEAILHHIIGRGYTNALSQKEMDLEIYDSAKKIRSSAAFGEIIILIVYLPILALVGIEGKMFKPMAQTVSFAILGAFILSLTYVPMISSIALSKKISKGKNISDRFLDKIQGLYTPLRDWALKFDRFIIGGAILMLIFSIWIFLNMGGEFIPTLDEGDFAVETRVLTGSSMSQTIDAAQKAAKILKSFPEVKEVVGKIGTSEIPTDPMPLEACDLMVILKDKEEWKRTETRDELAEKMQLALKDIPGVSFSFQQPIQMRFNELMTGAKQDVAIKIFGEDLDVLALQAENLGKIISHVDGLKDLYVEKVTGLPQIVVKYHRERIAQYGVNIQELNKMVRTAFAGDKAGVIFEGERRYGLVLRLAQDKRQSIDQLRMLYVSDAEGRQIPLTQLADVEYVIGPNQIQREDAKRRITIGFNVRGRDVESVVSEIEKLVAQKMKLPPGYFITYGGQFKNLVEAKKRLGIAVPLSLILIFVLLFFTFQSFKQSLLIFTSIPLSAIGGVWALWLRDMPFSISAGIGFIALFGVAVLNGIVLLGEFNRLKQLGGYSLVEIIKLGTEARLRPVMMTAMVASLGFLPMALSNGSGAEVQRPLATVVVGGLVTATLLTLLILPILYIWVENKKIRAPQNITLLFCFVLILFCSNSGWSQTKELSLDEAIQYAIKANPNLRSLEQKVEYWRQIRGASTDIGRLNANFMYGQYNSYYKDNNIQLSHTMPLPNVIWHQSRYYDIAKQSAMLQNDIMVEEIKFKVKSVYDEILFEKSRLALFQRQDSLLLHFFKATESRFKQGEANLLEKSIAESHMLENKMLQQQQISNIEAVERQLRYLTANQEPVTVKMMGLNRRIWEWKVEDTTKINQNPILKFYSNQIFLAQQGYKLEKARLTPEFNIGYFSQTMFGTVNYSNSKEIAGSTRRFHGFTLGVGIPLWIKPQNAKIKAQDALSKVAQYEKDAIEYQFRQSLDLATIQYLKSVSNISYYEQSAMPTAKLISENALKNFHSGNIDYLEFVNALSRSFVIEQGYLDSILQYNKSILYLEFLIGQQ